MQTAVHLEYLCFGAIAFESASKYIHLFSESQLYKMSIPFVFVFVFVRFFSLCLHQYDLHTNYTTTTLYALPTWQQLTHISICEL